MFDGQPETPGTGGAEHQPVRAAREVFLGQGFAEQLVIDAEIFDGRAALGDAGSSAGLEDIDRLAGQSLGNPAAHGPAAQPLVLKFWESLQVLETVDLLARIPTQRRGAVQPEGRSGVR